MDAPIFIHRSDVAPSQGITDKTNFGGRRRRSTFVALRSRFRQSVQAVITTACFSAALILTGCAGGGGEVAAQTFENGGLTATPIVAQVTIPAGAPTEPVSSLEVWTSGGKATPGGNGQVNLTIFNNGPQYSEARDSQGRLVAAGFIGTGRTNIDAGSTAEMMTFFAIGGGLQRGTGNARLVLAAVRGFAGFEQVEARIAAMIQTMGFVDTEDADLLARLAAIRDAISSGGPLLPGRGPTILPTKSASGLDLNDAVDSQVQVTNKLYRRAYAVLTRTGYKKGDGQVVELNVPIKSGWIVMPNRFGGTIESASGLISGQYEWTPEPTAPYETLADIPESTEETEAYYKLVTFGPGKAAGDFNDLTTEQSIKWEESIYTACYLDFFLPIFANLALPLDGTNLDDLTEFFLNNGQVTAYMSEARSLMPTVASQAAQGNMPAAISAFVSSSNMATRTIPLTNEVMKAWAQSLGQGLFENQADLIERIEKATRNVGMLNLVDATSSLAPLSDLEKADLANIFEITSTKGAVSLAPKMTAIGVADTTDVVATINGKVDGATYRYEWTVAPNGNYFLMDGAGNSTDASPNGVLVSTFDKVFIGSLSTESGEATISCKAFRTDGGEVPLGTGQTKVTFTKGISVYLGRMEVRTAPVVFLGLAWKGGLLTAMAVPKKDGATFYSARAVRNGVTLKTASWAANNPPALVASVPWRDQFLAMIPANETWVTVSTQGGGVGLGQAAAEQELIDYISQNTAYHQSTVVIVTANVSN